MKTLHFDTTINAPRAVVWRTMLDPEGYQAWTAAFCEGSRYEGSWDEGADIRFMGPDGGGMFSRIAEHRPQEFVSIHHLGMIHDGTDDRASEQSQAWAGAMENYRYVDVPGGCRVEVAVDTAPDYEGFMLETFPKALGLLKQRCETQAG
jgi:hypothetical protein